MIAGAKTMFTGIIYHIGKLESKKSSVFTFSAPLSFLKNVKQGTSISVNGTCLTVYESPKRQTFSVQLMPETVKKTVFNNLELGEDVNLELPATAQTFLSGHIVQGHVDGVGRVIKIGRQGNSQVLTIGVPKNLISYIVPKGSIAINGISLTVVDVIGRFFTVSITPFTWQHTMFKQSKVGDVLNIEVDILAKYIEKLLQTK